MNDISPLDVSDEGKPSSDKKVYVKPTIEVLQVSGTKGKPTTTVGEVTAITGS